MLKKIQLSRKKKKKDIQEKRGIVFYLYKLLNFVLPIGLLILIRSGLSPLAILLALFSKWRVFAIKPRHLISNIRSNAVDIIVKLSTLAFMIEAETLNEQILWTMWYVLWLVVIKPASSKAWMALQAASAHFLGVSAIFLFSANDSVSDFMILLVVWLVAVSSARHYLSSYEEHKIQIMAHIWALFVLQLAWVLNKWTLVYVFVPQLIFIIGVVGYAVASIYDAHKNGTLKQSFIRQQAGMTAVILLLIIIFAEWNGI